MILPERHSPVVPVPTGQLAMPSNSLSLKGITAAGGNRPYRYCGRNRSAFRETHEVSASSFSNQAGWL